MAGNYGESYEATAERIRAESARYKAFKKNPQAIARLTLIVKRLDSSEVFQRQYEINTVEQDKEKETVAICYTLERSTNTVMEFVLHDQNDFPLFAIARTYSDWIGHKNFDLGDRVFWLKMVEAKDPAFVAVHVRLLAKT